MFIEIPQPTGSFGVGKSIHYLVDTTRNEKHGQGKRELLVYIYYPTEQKATAPYAQDIMPILKENLRQALNVDLKELDYLDSLKEHTQLHAPLAHSKDKFPLLFFSTGMGDPVETYTTLLEEMASQGYVVVAINHTYGVDPTVFPDGRIIRMNTELAGFWYVTHRPSEDVVDEEHEWWAQDAHFVIDRIKNIKATDSYNFLRDRLDYNAMGFFGHSLGGSLALQMCRERSDIQACADLDGILFGPLPKREQLFDVPALFITASAQVTDKELEQHHISREKYDHLVVPRNPRLLYEKLTSDSLFITLENSNHNSFSDLPLLKKPLEKNDDNPVDIIRQTRIILVEFFDRHLKNQYS